MQNISIIVIIHLIYFFNYYYLKKPKLISVNVDTTSCLRNCIIIHIRYNPRMSECLMTPQHQNISTVGFVYNPEWKQFNA